MSNHNRWILIVATTSIGVGNAGADPEPRRVTPHATVEVLDEKTPVEDVISQVRSRPPTKKEKKEEKKELRREKLERERPPARVDDKAERERNRQQKRERHEIDRDDRRPRRR